MRGEHLFEAITNIDEKFVEEANPANLKPHSKKPVLLYRYGAIAAMLVFVIGISALVLESGVLFSKSEKAAAPASVESTAVTTEAMAEEAEFEEAAMEEPLEEAAEEPAAPAETPAMIQEFAAGESPAEDIAAEAPAFEGVEEAAAEETAAARMIPDALIRYHGTAYEPAQSEWLDALPEGCTESGALSGDADAVWYAEDPALHGAAVWQPKSGEDIFYIEYEGGFVKYQRVS